MGVLGSLLAARAVRVGPVPAFHEIGLTLAGLAVAATLLSLRLPAHAPAPAIDEAAHP